MSRNVIKCVICAYQLKSTKKVIILDLFQCQNILIFNYIFFNEIITVLLLLLLLLFSINHPSINKLNFFEIKTIVNRFNLLLNNTIILINM